MNAFVTGGTGFIGSHLVDALLNDGNYTEIRCLVRNNKKWLKNKPIVTVKGDLNDTHVLREALTDVDIVFHIAGRVKAPTYQELEQTNVHATENLLRLARGKNIPKIVVLSSLAAVGPSNGKPVDESTPMQPVSNYGKSKKEMEDMIHRISDEKSSITILRPPAVYGPREDQIYSFFKMANYHICPVVGDGKNPEVSMIYVGDLVSGILQAAKQEAAGVSTYFITGSHIHNWDEICTITSSVLDKKTFSVYLKPGWVKKIASGIEKSASFFGIYPVLNNEKAKELILEWTCSAGKAKKELEYTPEYSLYKGISETINWYKKHKWL